MKSKKNIALIAIVAVAIALVGSAIAIKFSSGNSTPVIDAGSPAQNSSAGTTFSGDITEFSHTLPSVTALPSVPTSASVTENVSVTNAAVTEPAENITVTQTVTQVTQATNQAFKEVFTLPKAPKYVAPNININFDEAKIASYKYDPDGNFFYTDDKECWQSNLGFNEVYDNLAPLGMMNYDTVRAIFTYGGKEWLIQSWKGQYGYMFVGGEVGVYTRKPGTNGTHFKCADKEDWLKMEMAFMWDEYGTGEYRPIFNRSYGDYWWCTGFVVGFDGHKNRDQFRLVHHITFKDTEMALAFCEAMDNAGFTRVAKLNSGVVDTYVQVGADVAYVWQNIDQS